VSELYRFGHEAMATHFEIVIAGDDPGYAGQAADAAFADIDQIESELSRYRPDSDISQLKSLRAGGSMPVSLATFDCLSLAKVVASETRGAFDPAVAPLYEFWKKRGFISGGDDPEHAVAQGNSGSHLFELDEETLTIACKTDYGLHIDLGGIGKGYALDQASDVLREWGLPAALLNAGDSTVLALEPPPDTRAWTVNALGNNSGAIELTNQALSASGFSVKGSHIIDPRSGRPVPIEEGRQRIWARAPGAALADALSTAFMVMGEDEITALCDRYQGEIAVITL